MRIVIDLQGAQTESRFRGIGRYSLSLAQAIARNRGQHEVIIALNGLFPDTIEPLRVAFDGLLPRESIRVWFAPGPVCERTAGNEWRRQAAELIREAFLASLRPDVLHVFSLFEGYVDDAITSIGLFDVTTPVSVTLYDLIPFLNANEYLKPNPLYEEYYLRKIKYLKHASMLLSISEASRHEGVTHLGMENDLIVNISTATDENFRPLSLSEEQTNALKSKFDITRKFLLHTGGADERKNLPLLIRSYSQLSTSLRKDYQLVFAGKVSKGQTKVLQREARKCGLHPDEMIFTGYVPDEDLVQLYNACFLYVFPSWHEGFGLPALEAMACGAPVIGSNTSSLPEVIGREDALFDPYSVESITRKLLEVLTDNAFRSDLAKFGKEQAKKFSWDESAKRSISVFEKIFKNRPKKSSTLQDVARPKLAFVSPLPPVRSGIANYSSELLPELSRYYEIDVVVAQDEVADPWVQENCAIRNPSWLKTNANKIDRVLYQFGNSPFHWYMLELLKVVPGTVVLHDFFLSSLFASLEDQGSAPFAWSQELYHSHGYIAVHKRYHEKNKVDMVVEYPSNLSILQQAEGLIVHSEYARKLAEKWYGESIAKDMSVIPLLRVPKTKVDRDHVRRVLKLKKDAFVVCSFGFIDPTKLNHRILDAWLRSKLAYDERCVLIFVGENHGGDYGDELLQVIRNRKLKKRVQITGWTDMSTYRNYFDAANVAVQLRTRSRGETSAAILDCMDSGLATVVNANGSMADMSADAVWMIPDEFSDDQLVEALETLWDNSERRASLCKRATDIIRTQHAPDICANQYAEAIERFSAIEQAGYSGLIETISSIDTHIPTDAECIALSQEISQSLPLKQPVRQLLLDVTATNKTRLRTGIERVVRALVLALIKNPPHGFRAEPVYLSYDEGVWQYRYARSYTLDLLQCPQDMLSNDVVDPKNGDHLLCMDMSGNELIEAHRAGLFSLYCNAGVKINSIIYDLLPITLPEFFPPGADIAHAAWLKTIASFNGAICISKDVSEVLRIWYENEELDSGRSHPFAIDWFHLGSDFSKAAPTSGLPVNAQNILAKISESPSFLMVGTIEPRKGYLQVLEAFSQLWADGHDINLVIVGNEGWLGLPDESRRNIPEVVKRLQKHPESGKHLFWLKEVSDEYLEKIYAASVCLIAASQGEGFGLPLIEAAQNKLPIIARDIPVFREVSGDHAYYFEGEYGSDLVHALLNWLELQTIAQAPASEGMPRYSWSDSADSVINFLISHQNIENDNSQSAEELAIARHLDLIHQARIYMVSALLPAGDVILDLGGANCPLYKMGYPHNFSKLYLIDLPPEARHQMYREIVIDTNNDGGQVVIKYGDMTELDAFPDGSIDFVWSGQSIEHISEEAGVKMCKAAYRVLKHGGAFCLDTPNRKLTEIQVRGSSMEYIHPEHCIEYYPEKLKQMLLDSGFDISEEYGICEMGKTLAEDKFCYEDFIVGRQITKEIENGYIQFFHCVKP